MPRAISPVLQAGLIGYKRYLAWAAVFSFGVNLLTLAIPLYTIQVYDRVLSSGSGATLTVLTIAVLGGMVASAMLEDIRARLLVALGVNFDSKLATQLFERQIESHSAPGGAQTIRDLDTVRHVVTGSGTLSLFDLPWTPVFIAACFYLHPLIGGITLFGVILVLGLAVLNQSIVSGPLSQSARATEQSYRLTEGAIGNAETVRAMGMLPELSRRWSEVRTHAISSQASASARNATISSVIKLLRYTLQIAIMAVGAWLAVSREISPGSLFAASLICTRAMLPVDQIVGVWKQLLSGLEALRRVEASLAVPLAPRTMKLPRPLGRVAAEELTYTIQGAQVPTLSKVSFLVEPGESLGIVGPSAAGKSTLARLIVGALRPTTGSVRLDGAETWAWERADFGLFAGYVSQNIELFAGTIAENIARFKTTDSLAIVTAARLAGVHEMILALPKGYETVLAATGAPLSGGQRQRIALARAVFGDPKLIVLDEPNSNLDGEGEAALHAMLVALKARGTTVLMIAHRPSILASLDKVLVLRGGAVSDFGPIDRVMPRIAPGFSVVPKRIVGQA
jgi:PrtD family type I secretion system ABC transporter